MERQTLVTRLRRYRSSRLKRQSDLLGLHYRRPQSGVVNTHQDKANIRLITAAPDLLAICEEIANDSKCDLVNSERRIRLYSALSKAKGERIK